MALHTETKIYKHAYQLLNLSIEAKANMRRDFKNSLGSRIHDECIEVLVLIADANAAPNSDKPPVIRQMLRHIGTTTPPAKAFQSYPAPHALCRQPPASPPTKCRPSWCSTPRPNQPSTPK